MQNQEKVYFDALSKDRTESADILEKPSMRGVKNSIVEKYSDQAHFIYELLQNADDAKATYVRFDLRENELIFAHNGSRRFSVSDPETEEADTDNGNLGDINSITSIANSNKTEASIGKFGIGFKAVFQYTQTPRIYDPNFYFKIERLIVPIEIGSDFPDRKTDETLFVFPFDHPNRNPDEAYEDISEKLCSLIYPILFLTHLEVISFSSSKVTGLYTKTIEKEHRLDDTIAQLISLKQKIKGDRNQLVQDKLWLFTRKTEKGLTYSVGFFLGKDGSLYSSNYAAFCFFPTKESTGLNFIVHAPFLLTDSREGIKAGEKHNKYMIELLAGLAADSLIYLRDLGRQQNTVLIDDHIIDIIPYDESKFKDINDRNTISFKPFYTTIKEKFENEELLPSIGCYALRDSAYWAAVPKIAEIFLSEQIAELTNDKNAKWVFTSFGRDEVLRKNKALTDYIDSIINNWLNEDDILRGWTNINGTANCVISPAFIEAQSLDWLHRFYKWISDTSARTKLIKTRPVFLNQDGKAVAAFDEKEHAILFLPTEDDSGYETVNAALLDNEETAMFIKQLGITTPSLKDEIYNKILPQYRNGTVKNTRPHFKKFFQYYKSCSQAESKSFLTLLKDLDFVLFRSAKDEQLYRGKASTLYFPYETLRKWFQQKPDTRFVELDEYLQLVGKSNEEELISFLTGLGVKDEPRILTRQMTYSEAFQIRTDWRYSSRGRAWTDKYIDGSKEIIECLIQQQNANLSVVVWNQLLRFIGNDVYYDSSLQSIMCGKYEYFYYSPLSQSFDSSEAIRLRTKPWLLNNNGEFVSTKSLTIQTLSPQYDTSGDETAELLRLLDIRDEIVETDDGNDNLTEEQRLKIESYDRLKAAGITDKEIEEFIQQKQASKRAAASRSSEEDNYETENKDTLVNPSVSRVAKEITKRAVSAPEEKEIIGIDDPKGTSYDEDDYTKPPVDFSKKIEQAMQRSAHEMSEIAQLDELTQKAINSKKYTYGWFKALLELESLNSGENNANSRAISITFSKVEREEGTSRILILKHPNRYIPQSMEDLADIPLELHFANRPMVKVAVEVVNVKSYTLRAKLRTNAEIDTVDLSLVSEAKIEAKNPVFLLEELRKAFLGLGKDDDYDMQSNLCENIEFIFGPPGTGKTTHLANKVILPIMQKEDDLKVLVLTPTNKAADVLVRRIMESMGTDNSYTDWLVRFGATNDSVIEQSGVFRDKTFDIRTFPRNVTITTIARFPYDYFLPDEVTRLHLSALMWDYIIIDEASMIPLANIVLPLYKKTPEKFIIAGDPFQIEPITTVDIWKNENIYTMVELNSFKKPTTVPHKYHVELLTTQYRSIPEIGEVFSKFAYDGVLLHNRTSNSQRPLLIEDFIDVKPLNIIKFPVSKYESIYRPKRLQNKSNYQVYSALFAFELVKYLSSLIELAKRDEMFRIGLIAPYRAQSDLIDKLMSSAILPKNIDVQVGTIHGFQGDECDIIIALFNPPPSISPSKEMFLNKLNIINVSISRARDYLFVIMPDDDTENVGNLTLVKKVEKLFKEQPDWVEHRSHAIEELIFGSCSYLEDNSFSTSHQLVNVYGKPEMRYEVRSEDNAVDVQVHDNS